MSVVQALSLADELTLEPGGDEDEVVCAGVEGPNLAARALALFRAATGWNAPPQRLTIEKRIPVAAGMGGGSSDAAATLRLAARAAGRPVPPELAPRLGADVASLLRPGRVLMTGAGEHVAPLGPPPPLGVLVLPVAAELSTPAVYGEADRLGLVRSHARAGAARRARAGGDVGARQRPAGRGAVAAARRSTRRSPPRAPRAPITCSSPARARPSSGSSAARTGPARAAAAASASGWPRAQAAEPVDEAWAAVRG